ncbi:MAG: thymidine phosphorylase, partial [Puniceicoccales bacterium]|nr:thymidine phosphorylase [Puniceicoccales bacterium]
MISPKKSISLKNIKSVQPSFAYLIEKKREKEEFTDNEMRYIVESISEGSIPGHQLAALIMAIYFQGLSAQETAILAEEIILSGEVIDLTHLGKPKMGLYATGGVGDKSAMVLTALVAACGVIVPSVIGEDEDFILGNLRKLEAIPGLKTKLTSKVFIQQLQKVGCCFCAQSDPITPVDTILYKMRQSTATISSIPLMTGSILSKRLAVGAENLVVDIKWGNGAYVKDLEQARQLGRAVTRVARLLKRRCVALVTDMNQPLGDTVGTSLEIRETIELLQGRGPEDLRELILKLGMEMVRLAGVSGSTLSAKQMVLKHLNDGSTFKKFKEMVTAQGGDASYLDHPDKFPKAKHIKKLPAPKRGYIHAINAGMLAKGVNTLFRRGDNTGEVDYSVGISNIVKVGTQVKQGDPLMMIHYNDHSNLETALEYLRSAYRLAPKRPSFSELV